MRKYVLFGLMGAIALALVGLVLVPLQAQDGPSFQIAQPLPGQAITGSKLPIAITFRSADNSPVVRFEAYLDSTLLVWGNINKPIPAGSFRVDADLNGITIKPGEHTLTVKLYDRETRSTQHGQKIELKPATPRTAETNAPKVRIVSPGSGVSVNEKDRTTIRVEASDDSGIKWVMVYINNRFRAMMNEAPFEVPWNPEKEKFAPGMYTLTARAIDLFDNESVSSPVTVQVVSPFIQGLTPLEQDPERELSVDKVDLPFVIPVVPANGPSAGRQPFSNVVAPALAGLHGAGMPELAAGPRLDEPTLANSEVLAVLPPKTLPGQGDQALAILGPRGTALPPVLAVEPGVLAPARVSAPLPMRSPLLTPAAGQTAGRTDVVDHPTVAGAIPLEKIAPATGTVEAAVVPAPRENVRPAQPTLADDPTLLASLPGKVQPGQFGSEPLDAATVGTQTPLTPSTGPVSARPETGTITPRGTGMPDVTVASDARPASAQPVLIAQGVPGKAQPTAGREVLVARAAEATPSEAVMEVHATYTVKQGDTITKIARVYSTTPEKLIDQNPGVSPDRPLQVGTRLSVPQPSARIYLDNAPLNGGPEPFIVQGTSMVPIRKIVEAKGGTVVWLPKTREINAWANDTFMGLKIGEQQARINSQVYLLPVSPLIRDQRTMVPVRYLMNAMNLQLRYNPDTGTYYLASEALP